MSYLSKSNEIEDSSIIWPGFVDVLASTLMVIIFIVLLFTVSQVYLGDLVIGKNKTIQKLETTIDIQETTIDIQETTIDIQDDTIVYQDETLTDTQKNIIEKEEIISKNKEVISNQDIDIKSLSEVVNQQNLDMKSLNEIITQITDELSLSLDENNAMRSDIENLQSEQTSLLDSLFSSNQEKLNLTENLDTLRTENQSLSSRLDTLNSEAILRNEDLEIALVKISNLSNNVELLTNEILTLNGILETKEKEMANSKIEIEDLGDRLNRVLTSELFKLQQYRSEFFGRLNQLLADRSEITVQGDRFVFQSEILFYSGSAEIQKDGKESLSSVSAIILELISEIPTDLNWILQVDGHTDKIPIYTQQFPSNWELSHARALEVVKFFISQGIPSYKLSANGYGDNQPINLGDTLEDLKSNRRIELKITQM
ncbi:OmpA family protein [Alphaproteobacteria bacterium]|nr:OmpA family protein [Alphaproteobacteria bacterium]